jgi:hypothetical protein
MPLKIFSRRNVVYFTLGITALLTYQNSKLNKCKVDAFIQGSYEIKVGADFSKKVPPQSSAASVLLMYRPSERIIYVPAGLYRLHPSILMQTISHELRHLMDAYNNEKNKVWPSISKAGKPFFQSRQWGNPKESNPVIDEDQYLDAQWNLVSSVDTDLSRISLHQAILKPIEKQTKTEQIQLRKLMALVKESKYLPTKIDRPISAEAAVFFKNKFYDHYSYNAEQDKYIIKQESSAINFDDKISLSTPGKSDVVNIKYHIVEFSTGPNAFWLTTYTNTHIHTLEDLTKDLLLNIRLNFDFIQKNYPEIQQLNEFSAYLDEVTSLYPKLREYLFPLLTNHEENRFSTELRACLNR